MVDDLARRAHSIFVDLLDREPGRRTSALLELCAEDTALREAVERLLDALGPSTHFLESPALGPIAAPAAPTIIRGYRIVRTLGVGGMATVYEAEQENPRRRVALKLMHRSLVRTSALRRFAFEAEVLARLKHPGIAQIYEAGTWEDGAGHHTPFFVMEFVADARPITDHARSMPLRQRLALFAEVCDAVQHGHQLGVIHRDLKPSNVLVDGAGRIRVIDFGIARSLQADDARITLHGHEGALLGTLNSMSPEQCRGGQHVDTRADVYSLGVLLYEIVTARLPHDLSHASIPDALRIIQTESPPRPGSLSPEARGDLEAIITMSMDKDPGRRYDGAGSLAAEVRRYLSLKTIQARLPSPWYQARLFARRHRVLVSAALVTTITILAASFLTGLFALRSWNDFKRRLAAEQVAVAERDDARRQAYSASVSSAFLSYQAGEAAQGRRRLAAAPESLRGWEWHHISALLESDETVVQAHGDMVLGMDFVAAARRIATSSRNGELAIWDADTGDVWRAMASADVAEHALALAEDGQTVYVGFRDGSLAAWTLNEGPPRTLGSVDATVVSLDEFAGRLACASEAGIASIRDPASWIELHRLDDQPGGVHGVRFSPDGTVLATWNVNGSLWLRDASGFAPHACWDLGCRIVDVAFSADGRVVAAGGALGKVRVWDAGADSLLLDTNTSPSISSVFSVALTPDGSTLFAGQIDRTLSMWTIANGAPRQTVGHQDEAIIELAFDEQSDRLISASRDRTLRFWPTGEDRAPDPQTVLDAHGDNIMSIAFSCAGDLLASAGRDDVIHLWEPTLRQRLATLRVGHDVHSVRFSPDGAILVCGSIDGTVRLWNTLTGEAVDTLNPPEGGPIVSVEFTPDGSRFAAAGDDGIITFWDTPTRSPGLSIVADEGRVIHLAFSPDGEMLASCLRDGSVQLWNAASGSLLRTLRGHESDTFSCAFAADGSRLYTGSRDQTVRIWNPGTGEAFEPLKCPGQFVTTLSIDSGGTRLAAGSWFAEVTIWDLPTHCEVFSFKGQSSAIRSLAFSPIAPVLVCGGHDGTLTIYDATPRSHRHQARERARAALAAAESILAAQPSLAVDPASFTAANLDTDGRSWLRKAILRRSSTMQNGAR